MGYGACAREQNELVLALGPRRDIIPRDARKTSPQCGSTGQGQ